MPYDRAITLFREHLPQATFRPQPASDWAGEAALPPAIAAYYTDLGPDDVELQPFPDPIFLPDLASLWGYQEHHQYDITTWQRQPTWRDGWFFLADLQNVEYGHLVFDSASGQVLRVTYDDPGWIASSLFPTLELMALALAILTTPVADPQTSPDHAADVRAILAQLREVLSEEQMRTVLSELRWVYTPTNW